MSVKGDAQSEAPSSRVASARALAACARFGGRAFAAFLALHFGVEAARAATDGAIPRAGIEAEPLVAALVLLGIVLPFAFFVGRSFALADAGPKKAERSLVVLERLTLLVTALFLLGHLAQFAYPLLNGSFRADDVRPELVAALSSTEYGLPLTAVGYALGVGAASFVATRAVLRELPETRRKARRVVVALGALAYLLGSFAVIRCATGPILQ